MQLAAAERCAKQAKAARAAAEADRDTTVERAALRPTPGSRRPRPTGTPRSGRPGRRPPSGSPRRRLTGTRPAPTRPRWRRAPGWRRTTRQRPRSPPGRLGAASAAASVVSTVAATTHAKAPGSAPASARGLPVRRWPRKLIGEVVSVTACHVADGASQPWSGAAWLWLGWRVPCRARPGQPARVPVAGVRAAGVGVHVGSRTRRAAARRTGRPVRRTRPRRGWRWRRPAARCLAARSRAAWVYLSGSALTRAAQSAISAAACRAESR